MSLNGGQVWGLAKDTVKDFLEDKALRLSAALAYYAIFSMAPLLVICISIAGWFLGPEAAAGQLGEHLKGFLGNATAEAVESMIKSASKPSDSLWGGIIGFCVMLLGASGIFGQLKDALNTIWEVKPISGGGVVSFLKERFLSFGMVLVIGFLLLTSLVLTTSIAAVGKYMGSSLTIPPAVLVAVTFVISLIIVTTLFALIFKILPDVKLQWRNVWVGAALTALLFEVGKFGLGIYLGRESTASSFGAAGSIVLVLLWVYYASCILLFGAEFTQVYAKFCNEQIDPAKNAQGITLSDRQAEGLEGTKQVS